ncbi:hypothetical protein AMECASPLE_015071 [Ameca splendens]|uniref:Uncharacterized protein n=1 Tax=Ameca splendens TaxID=208324 RepID=A0ABV0YCV7_9TELE
MSPDGERHQRKAASSLQRPPPPPLLSVLKIQIQSQNQCYRLSSMPTDEEDNPISFTWLVQRIQHIPRPKLCTAT